MLPVALEFCGDVFVWAFTGSIREVAAEISSSPVGVFAAPVITIGTGT